MSVAEQRRQLERILGDPDLTPEWEILVQAAYDSIGHIPNRSDPTWRGEVTLWKLSGGQDHCNRLVLVAQQMTSAGLGNLAARLRRVANGLNALRLKNRR